jgi:predicted dehydrogenase
MTKARLALIGCGPRGLRGHGPGLTASAEIEMVAVCDVVAELARDAAAKFGVEAYTDHRELLRRPDLDGVVIVVSTRFHAPIALDAVRAGKHVLLEKPMAESVAAAEELLREAERAGVRHAIGYQSRFRLPCQYLQEQSREIDPVQIIISRPRGMMAPKYLSPDPSYGIMDYVSHDFDLALWLMGRTPTAVSAVTRRSTFTDTGALDVISAMIEFGGDRDRRSATIHSTMGAPGLGTRYEVIGSQGFAALSGREVKSMRWTRDAEGKPTPENATREIADPVNADATAQMHRHFARCLLDPSQSQEPLASFADGLRALRVSEAIVRSGDTGERVVLSP